MTNAPRCPKPAVYATLKLYKFEYTLIGGHVHDTYVSTTDGAGDAWKQAFDTIQNRTTTSGLSHTLNIELVDVHPYKGTARIGYAGGKTDGRWPHYRFYVNGFDLGVIKRTVSKGADRMTTKRTSDDAWMTSYGLVCCSQAEAEQSLIERFEKANFPLVNEVEGE